MLFRKDIEPSCSYCKKGVPLGNGRVGCVKYGVVNEYYKCRSFSYDPLKRVPPAPAPLKKNAFSESDFSID